MCLSVVVDHENFKPNWGHMNKSGLNTYVLSAEKAFYLRHNIRFLKKKKWFTLCFYNLFSFFHSRRNWVMSVSWRNSFRNEKKKRENEPPVCFFLGL